MTFSMPSFFIGVGTVVAAIALGFGGGVLLTSSAIKETPAAPTRVERLAQPDQASPKIVARAETTKDDANPPAVAASSTAVTDSAPPASTVIPLAAQAPSVSTAPPAAAEPKPPSAAPMEQVMARDSEPLTQRETERQRRAERLLERKKLYAERRAQAQAVAKMRQQQFEVREQVRPELAFEREDDAGFDFFGRSNGPRSVERD